MSLCFTIFLTFSAAPAGKKRIPVKDEAKLQRTVDGMKQPIPGNIYKHLSLMPYIFVNLLIFFFLSRV